MPRALTEKQRRFIEAYMGEARGNATEAARAAGYKGTDITLAAEGCRNLKKPAVRKHIDAIVASDPAIANRDDRQRLWTQMMYDEGLDPTHRLRASELLAKTQGDFVPSVTNVYSVSHTINENGQQLRELAWREIVRERQELGLPLLLEEEH